MTTLFAACCWLAIQTTLLAASGLLVHLALRKAGPSTGVAVALGSLVLIGLLPVLALSPWPNWTSGWWTRGSATMSSIDADASMSEVDGVGSRTSALAARTPSGALWASVWQGLGDALSGAPEGASATARSEQPAAAGSPSALAAEGWRPAVLGVFGLGVALGLLRLIGGLAALRRLCRTSVPLHDAALTLEVDLLRAELQCTRRIELRECPTMTTAATFGARRAVLLLPPDWRTWGPVERRAVLAHEISHIQQRDFLAWLLAQLSVTFHFYHPLVHWLAGCLRLDQELRADTIAAGRLGGRQQYLATLATLAIRGDDRPVGWPAAAFLPTRRTFLRRLEMLRDPRSEARLAGAWSARAGLLLVALAAVIAVGLRAPGPALIQAQDAALLQAPNNSAAGPPSSAVQASLAFVPRDALLVAVARPARLAANPLLADLMAELVNGPPLQELGLGPADVDQVTFLILAPQAGQPPEVPTMLLRMTSPAAAEKLAAGFQARGGAHSQEFEGQKIQSLSPTGAGECIAWPDPLTFLTTPSIGAMRRMLVAGAAGSPSQELAAGWGQASSADVAVFGQPALLAGAHRGGGPIEVFSLPGELTGPLLAAQSLAVSLNVQQNISLRVNFTAANAEQAAKMKDTAFAMLVIARNAVAGLRAQMSEAPSSDQASAGLRLADVAEIVLTAAKLEQRDRDVTIEAVSDAENSKKLVAGLLPAIKATRAAAQASLEMNNLRQIALAFHIYHDVHGHFPPAAVVGPDGKTKHSWRVALLPYLEQQALYDSYKLNEPWDSPANLEVLKRMPAIYGGASAGGPGNFAGVYVLTGPGTVFDGDKGTPINRILDGLSNTILAVKVDREIPWTRPEDIAYDPQGPVPELAGSSGMLRFSLCDGAVMRRTAETPEAILRALITRDGREVIQY